MKNSFLWFDDNYQQENLSYHYRYHSNNVINRTIFSDINSREKFFLLCWLDRIRFADSDVEGFFYESICLMERFLFLFFSVLSDILEHSCTFHSVKIFQSVLCLCKEERITCINLFLLFNLRFPFPGERNLSLSLRSFRTFVDSFTWLRYKET